MRIAEINMSHYGSTGTIMLQIADCVRKRGGEVKTYSTYYAGLPYRKNPPAPEGHSYFGSHAGNNTHLVLSMITGKYGCFSHLSTYRLIKDIARFSPDIVHLHNLHSAYLNLPMLFRWLNKSGIKIVWTFHDCWPLTAKCTGFELCGCEKWKTGCHDCEQLSAYPKTWTDRTPWLWKQRKKWFTKMDNLTIVTPSKWLAKLVKQSYFKNTSVLVINNGIDLQVFRPTESNFRKKHNCEDKFIILGVADSWGNRKGLDVFVELSKRLDTHFQIVLAGTTDLIDQTLPKQIISIHRTRNPKELAEIYSAADLFVNPTLEDNYPTVNMEAIACGTPVLTFRTGGSPEMLDERTGIVVDQGDVEAMEQAIHEIQRTRPFSEVACIGQAAKFDKNTVFDAYYSLYTSIQKGT